VSAYSVRQAGRVAAGAISFLAFAAACAEATNPGELGTDPLTQGGTGGTATGGTSTDTAGMSGGGGGSVSQPVAGTPSTGGSAVAGSAGTASTAGSGGGGGIAGMGGGGAGGMGGKGGSGGTGGAGGSGGSGGSASTGFRYAKLVATSELAGAVWSSVAELQIMTTGNTAISRSNWVITADSQETDDEMAPATNAIDGDNATFWHTAWEPAPDNVNDAALPHSLIVDMVMARTITGFSYLPRQDRANGRIKNWEFYVSKDGTTWGTALKKGTFPDATTLQTVVF
jgi:hypothetical protein